MMRPVLRATATTALLLLCGTSLAADDRPPANLHQVGDHWTAWDPPVPGPNDKVHIVVPGDTLWDLARTLYGDPYLWPQLWERNQYVLDAHWIYPGDPLFIEGQVDSAAGLDEDLGEGEQVGGGGTGAAAGDATAGGAGSGAEGGGGGDLANVLGIDEAAGPPAPLGAESDIYCSGYVGEIDEVFPHSIVGSEYEAMLPSLHGTAPQSMRSARSHLTTAKYGLSTGDIVYVDGGRASGLSPGSLFTIIDTDERVVSHPRSNKPFGRLYHYAGRLRILSVQDETAIAEIVFTCDPITVGARLKPFEPEPVPLARRTGMRPVNFPPPAESLADAPVILLASDRQVALGDDNVVYIDRGLDADVTPGDIYTIYRLHPKGLPPVVVGELAVLSVHPHSSVAKIIAARHTIYPGDLIELK